VLLTLALLVQVPVGAIVHLWSNSNPLALDLVFFQPQYVVLACFLVMPLAARLTGQARRLRLLESLSLGILYALLGLYISTALVHPSSDTQPTDQFIKHLQGSDYLLLALADVVALFGTVAVYPGLQRLVTAPGRRARARLAARGDAPAAPQPARTSGSSASAAPRGRRR
jgi:hypothetical protein